MMTNDYSYLRALRLKLEEMVRKSDKQFASHGDDSKLAISGRAQGWQDVILMINKITEGGLEELNKIEIPAAPKPEREPVKQKYSISPRPMNIKRRDEIK